MKNKFLDKQPDHSPDNSPVPDGQERLATQAERDDVNEKIEGLHEVSVSTSDQD